MDMERLSFPYLSSFTVEGNVVEIHYVSQVESKLIFHAWFTSPQSGQRTYIIVKFTKRYCREAHEICYQLNGGAPLLYDLLTLPGGWIAVVMEDIRNMRVYCKESDFEMLCRLLNHLHEATYVHGDLRLGNILFTDNRVCLIDFDWSGLHGVQCYPAFMNHTDIVWPADASDGLPLKKEHDLFFLHKLQC
jgi:serine/threonine protein kinase